MPKQLRNLLAGLTDTELQRHGLYLQNADDRGKGVFTSNSVPEGEVILQASCLLFTGWAPLLTFLRSNEEHKDAAAWCQKHKDASGGPARGQRACVRAKCPQLMLMMLGQKCLLNIHVPRCIPISFLATQDRQGLAP